MRVFEGESQFFYFHLILPVPGLGRSLYMAATDPRLPPDSLQPCSLHSRGGPSRPRGDFGGVWAKIAQWRSARIKEGPWHTPAD